MSNKCKRCGYEGKKEHNDLYDCQDYLDPTWMYKWFVNLKKEKSEPYLSDFAKWSKKYLILFLLLGCEDAIEKDYKIDIQADDFSYPINQPFSYHKVTYKTNVLDYVSWSSPDSFKVVFMGRTFIEPIIRYSTYPNEYGEGQQMIYISESHRNTTLTISGCIVDVCDTTSFKVY